MKNLKRSLKKRTKQLDTMKQVASTEDRIVQLGEGHLRNKTWLSDSDDSDDPGHSYGKAEPTRYPPRKNKWKK